MANHNQWYYTIQSKPDATLEQVLTVLRTAIGREAQEAYFPVGFVLDSGPWTDPPRVLIHFDAILANAAEVPLIERALYALHPLIEPEERVAALVGRGPGRLVIYRFTVDGVKHATGDLTGRQQEVWRPVTLIPTSMPSPLADNTDTPPQDERD